jgi:Type II secretion system (T2SS), protein N
MRGRWFIAVLILALIALFPLRVALGMAGPGKIGLSADRVEGSIWRGSIHTLSIGPVVLGDVQTRLRPLFLLKGAIQSHFSRPGALDGDAYIGVNTAGVRGARSERCQPRISPGPLRSRVRPYCRDAAARRDGTGLRDPADWNPKMFG